MKYFLLLTLILGCVDPQAQYHRISEDKTEEILYLQENIALHRMFMKNAVITLDGATDKDVFEIVSAHWLNKPTLSSQTGDRIDEVLVEDVEKIGRHSLDNVLYGTCKLYSEDWRTLPEKAYFILRNARVDIYADEKEFIQKLKEYGVDKIKMIPSSQFISQWSK